MTVRRGRPRPRKKSLANQFDFHIDKWLHRTPQVRWFLTLRLQQKLSTSHDLLAIHPDIKVPSHHIDMRGGIPLSAGVHAIRIAEGDVCSRVLFILENLSDHILQLDISAIGELAHNVAVLVRVGVSPEVSLQFSVGRVRLREPIALYLNRQRIFPQTAKLCAEIITYHAIDPECAVDFT